MKILYTFILLIFSCTLLSAQVFINELHYDNAGTDADEGFEVAGPAGTDLSCYKAFFYNGSNGALYDSLDLSGTIDDEGVGYGAVWFAKEGIQNGSPDAMGLVNYCTGAPFIPGHFISYEGGLMGSGGPFDGLIAADIGVAQDNTTVIGNSLQLIGTGQDVTDFLWTGPVAESRGSINVDQSFGAAANPSVGWSGSSTQTVSEDAGSVFIQIDLAAANMNDTEILTTSILGDASVGFDFDIVAMPTLFSSGVTSLIWEMSIIDDIDAESSETIEVTIMTVSNSATIVNATATITIEDNDTPIAPAPSYDIADVTTENADGIADSLMVECSLTGIVTTQNFRPDGQQFYMQDETGGINVFAFSEGFDYETTIGDEITVTGVIDQYNGLTEIIPTGIELLSQDNTVEPLPVTELNDENEGLLVTMGAELVPLDTAQWLADGSSFNVDFLNGSNDTVTIRVDDDTDLASILPDSWWSISPSYAITGVVGQYDTSSPYTSGYQLFPRNESDIEATIVGIEENFTSEIYISPNPVNDILQIASEEIIENVEIYSLSGKTVYSASYRSNINLSHLEAGVYFLRAVNGEKAIVRRFVKE